MIFRALELASVPELAASRRYVPQYVPPTRRRRPRNKKVMRIWNLLLDSGYGN